MNIVFIHRGYHLYLQINLKRLKYLFKNANIILLGDEENEHLKKKLNINFDYIYNYQKNDDYNYYHLSVNTYDYEKFCVDRWFILRNYMIHNNVNDCFYFDSDVFVLSAELKNYMYNLEYDAVAVGKNVIVPTPIFFKLNGLLSLCDNIKELYTGDIKEKLLNIVSIYNSYQNGQPHISDMFFLHYFLVYSNMIENVFILNSDHDSNDYIINTNVRNLFNKRFEFSQKNRHHNVNKKKVLSLHLQGNAKQLHEKLSKFVYMNKSFYLINENTIH
jgi:hypothetical protein